MSQGKIPKDYTKFLQKDGLKGARIAVFTRYINTKTIDPQIKKIFLRAVDELKKQGATVITPFDIPDYDKLIRTSGNLHFSMI